MSDTVLTYDSLPAFGPFYKNILFKSRKGMKKGDALPDIRSEWKCAQVDPERLKAYREVCALPASDHLPILYPHILTGGLHMAILTHEDFPLSLMGAVHMRINILEYRPIDPAETLDIVCALKGYRVIKAGIEIDVTTLLTSGGEPVWESLNSYLVRGKYGEPDEASPYASVPGEISGEPAAEWHVPNGQGRKYAAVCGDYNPIHLYPITAKLFGFKRDIIHGMWSAAKCLGNVDAPAGHPQRCDVLFKGPVFMDSHCRLIKQTQDGGQRFDLFCGKNDRPVIQGFWREGNDTVIRD